MEWQLEVDGERVFLIVSSLSPFFPLPFPSGIALTVNIDRKIPISRKQTQFLLF